MDKGPILFVLSSDNFDKGVRQNPEEIYIKYRLPRELRFSEPHLVKLSHFQITSGPQPPSLVITDFTKPQIFDGEYLGVVGVSEPQAINDYIPLLTNNIPPQGEVKIRPYPGLGIHAGFIRMILTFYIVPHRYIYGDGA